MDVWTFQRNAAKYNNTINFGRRYKAEAILCDRGSRKIEHYAPARQPLMPSCCVVSACISVDTISVAVFNQESSFYMQTFISQVGLGRRKSSAVHTCLGDPRGLIIPVFMPMLLSGKFWTGSLGKFLKSQFDSRKRRVQVNVS